MWPRGHLTLRMSMFLMMMVSLNTSVQLITLLHPYHLNLHSSTYIVATISFSPQNSSVREGNPVYISIVLDRKVAGSITFTVNTTDNTANKCEWMWIMCKFCSRTEFATYFTTLFLLTAIVASEDYAIVSNTVTIPAGERHASPLLLILKDNLTEEDEYFKATLTLHNTPFKVEVGPDPAFVTIIDATGKSALMYCTFTLH